MIRLTGQDKQENWRLEKFWKSISWDRRLTQYWAQDYAIAKTFADEYLPTVNYNIIPL